jgi:hypothetical protein
VMVLGVSRYVAGGLGGVDHVRWDFGSNALSTGCVWGWVCLAEEAAPKAFNFGGSTVNEK